MGHVRLVVRGDPVPQGSMVGFASRNPGHRGVVTVKPSNEAKLKPWRAHVAKVAVRAMLTPEGGLRQPLDGPLAVRMVFTLTRPATITRLDPSVPPDVDKLARAVMDALGQGADRQRTGKVWADDARVINLAAEKAYPGLHPEALDWPGVLIHVWQLADA